MTQPLEDLFVGARSDKDHSLMEAITWASSDRHIDLVPVGSEIKGFELLPAPVTARPPTSSGTQLHNIARRNMNPVNQFAHHQGLKLHELIVAQCHLIFFD